MLNYFTNEAKRKDFVANMKNSLDNFEIPLDLKEFFGCEKLNMLEMGRPGSGKSAGINSMASTLHESFIQKASTSSSQESHTQHKLSYPLNSVRTIFGIHIFGFSGDNFLSLLQIILEGRLRNNYKKGDILSSENQNFSPTINDQIHAVVFVMDTTNLDKKMVVEEYEKMIRLVQNYGFSISYFSYY